MARIEVEPGYTVEPKYLDLEEGETLCPDCHGKGRVVWLYASTHHEYGYCFTCYGSGKIASCERCGKQRQIVKHPNAWADKLCIDCIRSDPRLESSTNV